MRVLLVAEGKHEHGSNDLPGALEILVHRLTTGDIELKKRPLSRKERHTFHGKGKGHFKKAVRCMLDAEGDGFDALVLLVDEDGKPERRTQIDDAQEATLAPIKRALGVAVRTFDAWMLADEGCLSEVLDVSVRKRKDPEKMRDPKRNCQVLLDRAKKEMTQTQMYSGVMNALDLSILEKRCPDGFAPFAKSVRALQRV